MEILFLLLLFSPVVWELINDREGDVHPNKDWIMRGAIMIVASFLVAVLSAGERGFFVSLGLSFAMFSFFFNYLYNLFNGKKPWYSYLSLTAIPDKWEQWRGTPWYGRFIILAIILGTALSLYFWKEMLIWNYPYGR